MSILSYKIFFKKIIFYQNHFLWKHGLFRLFIFMWRWRTSNICIAGNKAKGRISKRVFQEKARQIFRKTNISYPLIRTRTCVYQGVRNVRFSENLACFVFLKHPFWDSPFCFLTDDIMKCFCGSYSQVSAVYYFRKKSSTRNICQGPKHAIYLTIGKLRIYCISRFGYVEVPQISFAKQIYRLPLVFLFLNISFALKITKDTKSFTLRFKLNFHLVHECHRGVFFAGITPSEIM